MDEFIKMLNEDYELMNYRIKEKIIVFEIASNKRNCTCPYCGMVSSRVHSTYQRDIQDLPIHNKQTILLVNTRKMFCDNPDCQVTTFAERHPFVAKSGKKTERLVANILATSLQLSSISASKLLSTESIKICKSSICTLLKKNAVHCK
ncbi:MAG: transposase family protein [Clostridiaceae bacterium]